MAEIFPPNLNSYVEKGAAWPAAIYYRADGEAEIAMENESRRKQISHGDEAESENARQCDDVTGSASNCYLCRRDEEGWESGCSLQTSRGEEVEIEIPNSFLLFVEVASGNETQKASDCNSYPCHGVAVCANERVILTGSDSGFLPCHVEAETLTVSLIESETNSSNSCCNSTCFRCGHANCARDSLLVAEPLVRAWACS